MIFKDITDTNFNGIDISSHHEFNHEKVYYYEDQATQLTSLIAVHSTVKGPAIGGCRYRPVSYTHLTLPTNREV